MKKTILTIMVAAMMLVAFTACEQQPNVWNLVGKTVEYVTIQSGDTEYLVGQPFDASRYTLAITYKDGTTGTENGNGILSVADKAEDTAGSKSVDVTIGEYKGTLNVTYYDIDKLTIEGAATTSVVKDTTDPNKIDLTGATVTAYYANSGKTMELAENEYKVMSVVAKEVGADKGTVFVRYTGVAEDATDDAKNNAKYYATFTVDVTEPGEVISAADVTAIKSVTFVGDPIFAGSSAASAATSTSNWKVVGTDGTNEYTFKANEFTVSAATNMTTPDDYAVYIAVTAATKTPNLTYSSAEVTVYDDLTGIVATGPYALTKGSNEDYVLGATDKTSLANMIRAIKSGNQQVSGNFTIVDFDDPFIPRTSNSKNVTATFTWDGNGGEKEYTVTFTVTVTRTGNV